MVQGFNRSRVFSNLKPDSITAFATLLGLKVRVDEDGTKIIPGRHGHIYQYDDNLLGVMVMPDPPRKRYWGCARTALLKAGFTLVQDGDGEGAAIFDPENPNQARPAIRVAGIKRKRRLPPAQRKQRIAYFPPRSGTGHSAAGARRKPRKVGKVKPRRSKRPRTLSVLFGG